MKPNDNEIPTAEDWILSEAEAYEEKLKLANNTILVFSGMGWFKRLFKAKKLFKQYYRELYILDREHKARSESIRQKIQKASSDIVKEHRSTKRV